MPSTRGFLIAALVFAACGDDGGAASDTSVGSSTDTGAGDTGAGDTGATASSDAWDSVDGRTTHGVYLCCAPGEEREACCPPETLPDPEHGRTATCFEYGGVLGACVAAGGTLEAKDICATCCAGLVRVEAAAPGRGGDCEATAPDSVFYCAACGDGTCGAGENRCNCPADCP